ncbi:MAG: citrate synthase [bacterium]
MSEAEMHPPQRTPAREPRERRSGARTEFLSAREAAEFLDVKLPTLYAYASRGLIQSVPASRGRSRRYRRRDLERLCARRDARAGHGPVAAAALRQGEPVLDSSITLISLEEGPIYRGRSAVALARAGHPFESVAEGLWSGVWDEEEAGAVDWRPDGLGLDLEALQRVLPTEAGPLPVLSIVVPLLAAQDPGRFGWSREAVLPRARILLRRAVAALALGRSEPVAGEVAGEKGGATRDAAAPGPADGTEDAAEAPGTASAEAREASAVSIAIERSLAAPSLAAAIGEAFSRSLGESELAALNQALVLAADHELNASTFAARVAASTGADVYGCISAALAALSGPRHGGAADRVEALLDEAGGAERVKSVVHERQRRGEVIEGFGHPIYAPHSDPRGRLLIEIARELNGDSEAVQAVLALASTMQEGGFGGPSIDVGLVAFARALSLPVGSATALFAIGRSVGWVAHALEQLEAGYLVRPRARYRET